MKKIILSLAMIFGSLVNFNANANDNYYVGVNLGINNVESSNLISNLSALVKANGEMSFKSGVHGGINFGKTIDKMRYEIEYQYGKLNVDKASLRAVSKDFSESGNYQLITANAYRTYDFSEKLTGFIGAGIGYGQIKSPNAKLTNNCNCIQESNGYGTTYQAKIGVEYEIQKSNFIGVQYNWLKLPKPSNLNTNVDLEKIQSISISYRKSF